MPLDTTPGSATATAYASVAFADAYFIARGVTEWAAIPTTTKEQHLTLGTDYLDRKYAGRENGIASTQHQALAWPRERVSTRDGYYVDSTTVPVSVKKANCEAAYLIHTGTDLLPSTTGGTIKREKSGLGPLQTETEYSSPAQRMNVVPAIHGLLAGYIDGDASGSKGSVSLLRV